MVTLAVMIVTRYYGDRVGQHSIRINDQWRICFRWKDSNAFEVEIVDYH
jgi:proteic killer suppression protein